MPYTARQEQRCANLIGPRTYGSENMARTFRDPKRKCPGDAVNVPGPDTGGSRMPQSTVPPIRRRVYLRSARLRELGYAGYSEYLTSPHWRSVKARYRTSDQPQACVCGETESLQLHHKTYERIGEEDLTDLVALCGHCHAMIHVLERRGDIGLDFEGLLNEARSERGRAFLAEQYEKRRAEDMGVRADRANALDSMTLGQRIDYAHRFARSKVVDITKQRRIITKHALAIERRLGLRD